MVEYPQMLPLDAAQLCIDIVKNRQISERKVEFAHAAWNVQGYAQKMLLGDVNPLAMLMTENLGAVNEKLQELAEVLDEAEQDETRFSASSPEDSESVVVVLTIIGAIVQILSSLGFFKREDEQVDE